MATLDTNSVGATAGEITITTGAYITLFVNTKTGTDGQYRVGIEVYDGSFWIPTERSITGNGVLTINCVADKARAYLMKLPSRMRRIAERIVVPDTEYRFKWMNPLIVK